jgi:hypothetical protein
MNRIDRLVQEADDLLEVSSVGLYELIELLDGEDGPEFARLALERILARGGVELQWMRWPAFDSLGTISPADLPADPWQPPGEDGRYLALDRARHRDSGPST